MRKLLEKIKLFWTTKVVPVLQKIGKAWKWLVVFVAGEEFVYGFPLAVFGLSALILQSFLFTLAFGVWLIPTFHALFGKKEE